MTTRKPAAAAASRSADEQAIRKVVSDWHEATARGDVETILGLMAEDVVFLTPGQLPMTGRALFEAGLRELLKTHRIESSDDVREVVVSGDLAYGLTHLTVRVIPLSGGKAHARSGEALSIFRRQPDGGWILVRDANMMLPPDKTL
ncbi:MAG TPA: SgcJ/EcaC family oxidoreductase [Burkholderiales bacterium]|nr:SgcJ/EcaC family oxidoreductase [Burkholderiales bacterium]